MRCVERFTFDRCFDDLVQSLGGGASSGSAEGSGSLYTADDLTSARTEGFAEGYAEGQAAAAEAQRQAFERRVEQTLGALAREIASLLERTDAAAADAGRQAILVGSAIARKLLPRLYRDNARSEIEDVVAQAIHQSPADRPLIVRMAPRLADDLATRLPAIGPAGTAATAGLTKSVQVVGDQTIAEGDCRIEWPGGGLIRGQERLWREIEALVEEATAPGLPPPATAAPPPARGSSAAPAAQNLTVAPPPQSSTTSQPTGERDV